MKSIIDLSEQKNLQEEALQSSVSLFNQHGALQINGALDPDLLEETSKHFNTKYLQLGESRLKRKSSQVFSGRYLTSIQIEGQFNQPELFAPKKITSILGALLGEDMVLHAFGAITAFPNAPTQPIHIDHTRLFPESTTLDAFFPAYAIHLSIPLIDLNENTGTTAIWEGSHRKVLPHLAELQKENCTTPFEGASMPYTSLGDCLLTDFRLYHRGMHNKSDFPRPFLYMVFCRSWFHDSRNYPKKRRLKISNNEYKKIAPEYRSLFAQLKAPK